MEFIILSICVKQKTYKMNYYIRLVLHFCFLKFLFIFIFYTNFKGYFHLQWLQNIDCIPCVAQYILDPIFQPVVCTS